MTNFSKIRRLLPVMISLCLMIILPSICLADAEKIFRENSKAVVVIVTYDQAGNALSQGSGFVVRPDGVIVTNYHVISKARSIKIKLGAKVLDVVGVVSLDKDNDIAILKVTAKNLPIVKMGNLTKTGIGEKVYVISSPQGLENTISDGILSGKREIGPNKKVIQITAPISPGSSGGPVFNKDGQVIGITTFLLKDAQNLNFAMPVDVFKDKIEDKRITLIKNNQIEDYEKTPEYYFYLGVAYGEAGKDREAIEAYHQAIKLNPDYAPEIYFNLGLSYYKLTVYQDAIDAYKQAIRISPNFAEAHYNLGVIYSNLGRYQEAIESYKQCIRTMPNPSEPYNNLCHAYNNMEMKLEAIGACQKSIKINPDNANAHNNLAIAYMMSKRFKDALEESKQAIRISPDDASYHMVLGLNYNLLHDRSSALNEYKILKKLDPQTAQELFDIIYK